MTREARWMCWRAQKPVMFKPLNPVTLKRLRRFREMKRAYWSFWILAILYVLSLGSEIICNENPLYVRLNGQSYFPVFNYYPDDVFTGSGKQTRPDYKVIAKSDDFTGTLGNKMIFAPIPFGPFEIIDAETLVDDRSVTVKIIPKPRVATVNIKEDFSIARGAFAGDFFGTHDKGVKGLRITDYWTLSDRLIVEIRKRFDNRAAESFSDMSQSKAGEGGKVQLSVATYKPRQRNPKSVRLTIREVAKAKNSSETVVFDEHLDVISSTSAVWRGLESSDREVIVDLVEERLSAPVDARQLTVENVEYEIRFEKEDIRWPYKPVKRHWMGIDSAGRDVTARIIYGFRISVTFGFVLVLISMVIGIAMGAIQGYYGGKIDITAQRLIEIWSALPFLYIMILMGSIYGRSFSLLLFIYAIFNWIGISYYIRAEFLKLRKRPFVEAAQSMGISTPKIISRHILPNALVPVITFFPFSLVGAIGSLAALDYLGFGLPPPTPSWGELLAQAQQFRWAWWLILYPSLALFIVMLLGVFIGEGARHAFDPRRYSRME